MNLVRCAMSVLALSSPWRSPRNVHSKEAAQETTIPKTSFDTG